MQVLLPGDPLPSSSSSSSHPTLHLGPGLASSSTLAKGKAKESTHVAATRAGLLGHLEHPTHDKWWIEGTLKRYTPQPPEPILGIIVARHAEGYRVDIGASQSCSLDALAFEGATKRNKPNLKIGTVVYGYLLPTPAFAEPEMSCVDATTQKANGFGELQGGFLIRGVELGRCRALLSPKNPILPRLGAKFPFEVAVGMNGRVWVKAATATSSSSEEGEGEDVERVIEVVRELRGR
ncbi:hypothetical protein JCM1840_003118 [Sporobolomyces johnsonii]